MRTAVVGHTEWIEFGYVDRVPPAGAIAHARDGWEEAGGGGAVSAVQLARLAGSCTFFTALGNDARGLATEGDLARLGVRVRAARRGEPSRRAVTLVDDAGERTIVTLGPRLEPEGADRLPWDELDAMDAVYVTAGDVHAVRHARRARVVVGTSRALTRLGESGIALDAVVGSSRDPSERFDPDVLASPPALVVRTNGAKGGSYETVDGRSGTYEPAPPPGPIVDAYGAGDSFAAGLTYALGAGMDVEAAVALAARCGAWNVAGRGPYGNQLTADDLG
jgi:ribokinase